MGLLDDARRVVDEQEAIRFREAAEAVRPDWAVELADAMRELRFPTQNLLDDAGAPVEDGWVLVHYMADDSAYAPPGERSALSVSGRWWPWLPVTGRVSEGREYGHEHTSMDLDRTSITSIVETALLWMKGSPKFTQRRPQQYKGVLFVDMSWAITYSSSGEWDPYYDRN